MTKVMTIFGTRPEAIKMAPVVKALESSSDRFQSVVCVTGQHREMLDQVLQLFQIVPDYDLQVMSHDQTLASLTASVLTKLDPVIQAESPDWVLVQGDTTTAMAGSLAAFYRNIKVGHIEAGLRTNDRYQPFPEEINRRITSVIADLHFAPTDWAANNLTQERHPASSILVTGNTVIDAIQQVQQLPYDPSADFPEEIVATDKKLILVTAHRRENFGDGIREICDAIKTLVTLHSDIHVVFPVHLNPNVRGPVYEALSELERVTLLSPLEYQPLVWLMKQSFLILTDSGGIQEEAPGLGKPVLVLRGTTERPEGVEAGTVRLIGANADRIVSSVGELLQESDTYNQMANARNPYGDGNAANQILDAIAMHETP